MIAAAMIGLLAAAVAGSAAADTLDDVRARGTLICGVSDGLVGFAAPDADGTWQGFDVEFCRALAAAIFGDPGKAQFRPLSAGERYRVLKAREIDVLARGDGWTLTREVDDAVSFAGVSYFDAFALMVRRDFGLSSALELSGAVICAYVVGDRLSDLQDYFKSRNLPVEIRPFEKKEDALAAYEGKTCEAFAGDMSVLPTDRAALAEPADHMILADVIAQEPLGPVVRQGDDRWLQLVRWTLYALITAEQLGITRKNAADFEAGGNATARRLLGAEAELGSKLGLEPKWAFNIVHHVGNYGEMFDRTLGEKSPLGLDRGLNRLWDHGGLLFSPAFR